MAIKVGDLFYRITGNTSALDKSLNKSNKNVTTFGGKLGGIGKIIKGALFSGALLLGAKKVIDFSKSLISAASDAEETRDKFSVVFSTVADDAQDAADRIKTEFRLSDETVEKFLSGVGDITTGLGATGEEALSAAEQITKLGLDISSLSNIEAEQSVRALTSLFTGEREAAKALGIVINDTNLRAYAEDMGKIFKELTPLEKGFLSLELAATQSTLALDNAVLTADSYANTAKASAEATKDFKAALGESLLPAATASIGLFTTLTTKLTEYISEHNELRALLDKFAEDNDTAADRVALTEREIAVTQKLYDENLKILTLKQGTAQNLQEEAYIESLFATASALNVKLRSQQSLLATLNEEAAAEKEIADGIKAVADEQLRLTTLQLQAEDLLDTRRKSRLTDEELQLEYLNEQIDFWADNRGIAGAQELINDLVSERNELLREGIDLLDEEAEKKFTNYEYEKQALADLQYAHRDFTEATTEGNEEQKISYEELAAVGLGALSSGFESIGQALVQGKLAAADFGKLFLNSISAVLRALGAELTAMATVQLLLGNVAGAIKGYAESAAAFLASGIVSGLAGSFENGGIVPGTSYSGDNVLTAQNSGEIDINRSQQKQLWDFIQGGSNGGGGTTVVNAIIDKKVLFKVILDGSKNGQAQFDNRSVINK